jgi:hypothetical protein
MDVYKIKIKVRVQVGTWTSTIIVLLGKESKDLAVLFLPRGDTVKWSSCQSGREPCLKPNLSEPGSFLSAKLWGNEVLLFTNQCKVFCCGHPSWIRHILKTIMLEGCWGLNKITEPPKISTQPLVYKNYCFIILYQCILSSIISTDIKASKNYYNFNIYLHF